MSRRSDRVQRGKKTKEAWKMGLCRTSIEERRSREKNIWKDWRRAKRTEVSAVKDRESLARDWWVVFSATKLKEDDLFKEAVNAVCWKIINEKLERTLEKWGLPSKGLTHVCWDEMGAWTGRLRKPGETTHQAWVWEERGTLAIPCWMWQDQGKIVFFGRHETGAVSRAAGRFKMQSGQKKVMSGPLTGKISSLLQKRPTRTCVLSVGIYSCALESKGPLKKETLKGMRMLNNYDSGTSHIWKMYC